MGRCKHELIGITEYGTSTTSHIREFDGEWPHYSDYGDYTGKIFVQCKQCGLEKEFNRFSKSLPKWLILSWTQLWFA